MLSAQPIFNVKSVITQIQKIQFKFPQYQGMDNIKLQEMQNWKKQIIMDSVLNYLFDASLLPQDFLHSRILTLEHQQIVNLYSKLASLKHAISKNIQKEVQHKHKIIQDSFRSLQHIQNSFPKNDRTQLQTAQKYLEKFNKKYQTVTRSITEWKNTTKLIHFAQALQNFHVDSKLLKSMLKDFKKAEQKQGINSLKVSKIVKNVTDLSAKYDFTGMRIYQDEIIFIKQTKQMLYTLVQKKIAVLLLKGRQADQQIRQKLTVLKNIGKVAQFVTSFYKKNLKDLGQTLKKTFNGTTNDQFMELCLNQNSISNLPFKIVQLSKALIYLQQLFQQMKISDILVSNGIPNLFLKMWSKVVQYFRQILKWCSDNQAKEKQKNINRLLIWKYPTLFSMLTNVGDEVHLQIVQSTRYCYYNFDEHKQQLIFLCFNLAKQFYRGYQDEWDKFAELILKNKSSKQSLKMLLIQKQKNIIPFLSFLVPRVTHPVILNQLILKSQSQMNKIRTCVEQQQIVNEYNDFLFELKALYVNNPEMQIKDPRQISQFKLIAQRDYNIKQHRSNAHRQKVQMQLNDQQVSLRESEIKYQVTQLVQEDQILEPCPRSEQQIIQQV